MMQPEEVKMARPKEYIGTGEELEPVLKQMPKQQFRLIPLQGEDRKPFYETATAEEWAKELRAWAASHDLTTPPLSEEAISRESIYEGRGE
jgi:hypothetical protein